MPDAQGRFQEGEVFVMNGQRWQIKSATPSPFASNLVMFHGRSYAIEPYARPKLPEVTAPPSPPNRNDRHYLRRKKGRA